MELPEKQGLKPWQYPKIGTFQKRVAVELPEKQGLKHNVKRIKGKNISVAVELPEKQGLKLLPYFYIIGRYEMLQWNFQKNKD